MRHLKALSKLLHPTPIHAVELLALLLVVGIVAWLCVGAEVHELIALGFGAEMFSSNWKYIPFPLPLDRVLLAIGLLLLLWRGPRRVSPLRIRLQPIHFLLLAVVGWTVANGLWFGSFTTAGFYALLDRLGVVPFLMFVLAPLVFPGRRQRRTLLVVMVLCGLYLCETGLAEGVGVHALVFPRYIDNPAIGITQGRARGPFVESDCMGLALFQTAVFAGIGLTEWRQRCLMRWACIAVLAMTGPAILFTLTRSSWIGATAGAVAACLCIPRVRRLLPVLLVGAAAGVGGLLVLVPGLHTAAADRATTARSVWDRYNTNYAALRIIEAHPFSGIGWQRFQSVSYEYLHVQPTYPLTGTDIEVHNVFLSHFAELGLPGGLLWILALLGAVGLTIVRKSAPDLLPWRIGLLAMFTMFVIVANLVPLSYAFPNLILWSTAGIAAVPRNSDPRWDDEMLLSPADLGMAQLVPVP